MLKAKLSLLSAVFVSLFATSVLASFDIFDEDSEGYYGSGQTRPFKDAIENTDSLSAYDRAFLDSVEETRITDRWYGRVMAGKSQVRVNNLTNDSSSFLDPYVLNTGSINDNVYQLLLAGGHIWQQWAFEMEVMLSKKLSYFTDPVLIGSSPAITSTTPAGSYSTNASIELNLYEVSINVQYIIPRWFSFYPRRLQVHLDAGVGGAMKVADVTGTSNDAAILPTLENTSTRSYSVSGMLGIGARYQVSPCFLLGIAYRYFDLGKTSFGPVQQIKWQSNQLRTTGFFIDVTYQF